VVRPNNLILRSGLGRSGAGRGDRSRDEARPVTGLAEKIIDMHPADWAGIVEGHLAQRARGGRDPAMFAGGQRLARGTPPHGSARHGEPSDSARTGDPAARLGCPEACQTLREWVASSMKERFSERRRRREGGRNINLFGLTPMPPEARKRAAKVHQRPSSNAEGK
jgi:hypothetical protein